jgi:hypothetical protein
MRRDFFLGTLGVLLMDSSLGLARPHRRRQRNRRPEVVVKYIAAWRRGDGEQLAALFVDGGVYADDTGVALSGYALQDHVNSFRDARFQVVDVDCSQNAIVVHWRVGHGRCGDVIEFRDELVLSEDEQRILTVRSLGYPPSEEVAAVLQEYAAGWATYDGERSLATFAEGGIYSDSNYPDGISGQELIAYIESLTWAVIDGLYDLAVLKDGRVFARWNLYLAETGQLLVQGYDVITMQGNEILIVEGH